MLEILQFYPQVGGAVHAGGQKGEEPVAGSLNRWAGRGTLGRQAGRRCARRGNRFCAAQGPEEKPGKRGALRREKSVARRKTVSPNGLYFLRTIGNRLNNWCGTA